MTMNPVTWFEIYVDDLDRAKKFYEAVFGYSLIEDAADSSFRAYRFPGGDAWKRRYGRIDAAPYAKAFCRRNNDLFPLR